MNFTAVTGYIDSLSGIINSGGRKKHAESIKTSILIASNVM